MSVWKTVVHEVGHTLGLRHNFVAPEDGNASVMAYEDPLDTSSCEPAGGDAKYGSTDSTDSTDCPPASSASHAVYHTLIPTTLTRA